MDKMIWYLLTVIMLIIFWALPMGFIFSAVQGNIPYTPAFLGTLIIMVYFIFLPIKSLVGR